ncbi:MAG: phosphatase PAP2 family protein [Ignavibacteria bacterium]|nr:phosphatase PAP2 family protein [Ignavibacteria bacterium]
MKYLLCFLLNVSFVIPCAAESDSLTYFQSLRRSIIDDYTAVCKDASFVLNSFGNTGSVYSLSVAGSVVAATGGAYIIDEQVREELLSQHSTKIDKVSGVLREYGGTYSIIGSSAGLYVVGLITECEEVRTSGRLVLEAFIISGVVNGGLKVLLGRGRPYLNLGKDQFKPLNFLNDYNSLPSGHTTVAFTISTVLSDHIDRWWASVGLYTIAAATGISRIYDDKHWLSDVVLGASIGYFSGKLITSAHQAQRSTTSTSLRLYPTIGGVGCTYQF